MRKIILAGLFLVIALGLGFNAARDNAALAADSVTGEIFEISTAADLCDIANLENLNKNFILKNDIILSSNLTLAEDISDYETNGWMPLNTNNNSGTFDGGGFTIYNLFIDRPIIEDIGLFSVNSLNIKNLNIKTKEIGAGDFAVKSSGRAGILASKNYGSIDNVHCSGSVSGLEYAGGLIAENYGNIDNCSFAGNVEARTAGGLMGANHAEMLSNSFSDGKVTGHNAGGLIGQCFNSYLTVKINCVYSKSEINVKEFDKTSHTRAGGLIALRDNDIIILNSYSLYGLPSVASGDSDGIQTLDETEFANKESFIGFDFNNHWIFESGKIEQRKIAVSSNTLLMSDTNVKIIGDRNYYLNGEPAVLKLFAGGKENIGIKKIIIDKNDVTDNLINGEYKIENVDKQIQVDFEAWYLVKVEANRAVKGGNLALAKDYYAPNEDIIITVTADKNFKFKNLRAVFNEDDIAFSKIEKNTYRAEISGGYNHDSILYINASFKSNVWVWYVAGGGVLLISVITGIVIFIKRKNMRRQNKE